MRRSRVQRTGLEKSILLLKSMLYAIRFSFDAGAGAVLCGGCPEEDSAELDVECH